MRDSEMRHLTWGQIDFLKQILTVGKSKTAAGTGRTIPLNSAVLGIAGHVSRRMLSRYAHIRTEAKRRALEAVDTSHKTAEPVL